MKLYVLINGILTMPGSADNWIGRAATSLILRTGNPVEKVEYLSFATIHRLLGQRNRVKKLARTLSFYSHPKWQITLVGHSNGAAVALEALRYLDWPNIDRLVLFAPACERNFKKAGLLAAQQQGKVRNVTVLMAGQDTALRLADNWIGRALGYGDLGKDGPVFYEEGSTTIIRRSEWGHSDWWTESNLPWSIEQICKE